jgi:hypothetical protein
LSDMAPSILAKAADTGLAIAVVVVALAVYGAGCSVPTGPSKCFCPALSLERGYCLTAGPAPCGCPTPVLCPGWCLEDGGAPFPCDGGPED